MISIGSHIKMFKSHISRGIHHKRAPLKNSILENVIFLGAADRAQMVKLRPSLLSVGAAVHRAHCQCKQRLNCWELPSLVCSLYVPLYYLLRLIPQLTSPCRHAEPSKVSICSIAGAIGYLLRYCSNFTTKQHHKCFKIAHIYSSYSDKS